VAYRQATLGRGERLLWAPERELRREAALELHERRLIWHASAHEAAVMPAPAPAAPAAPNADREEALRRLAAPGVELDKYHSSHSFPLARFRSYRARLWVESAGGVLLLRYGRVAGGGADGVEAVRTVTVAFVRGVRHNADLFGGGRPPDEARRESRCLTVELDRALSPEQPYVHLVADSRDAAETLVRCIGALAGV